MRRFDATNLQIEESALTGESVATHKHPDPVHEDAGLGDRSGMAFSGTLVTSGRGVGVVTATGVATEIGRINTMIGEGRDVGDAAHSADGHVRQATVGCCRVWWERQIDELSGEGLRVLAAARRDASTASDELSLEDIDQLVFLGLVGIVDRPRPEAIESIATCRRAGINVKMITPARRAPSAARWASATDGV